MGEQERNLNTAPGQMVGYLYQPVRALYWLANGDGATAIGIETEDDITVRNEDGSKIREQDKSSIQENGWPYGDTSHALWNTLCIWVKAIKSNEIDIEKTKFFLVTNKTIPEASLVKQISEANDSERIKKCVERLIEVGNRIKKTAEVYPKVEEVLRESNLLYKLVEHINCETFVSSIGDEEKQKITMALHLTDREERDNIINSLLGWIIRTVVAQLNKGEPGWIRRNSFDNQLEAVRDIHRRKRVRASSASKWNVSDKEKKAHGAEIFVKQVEIIGVDDDVANDAVTDFVRFKKEKIRVASEGNITEEEWDNFNENLKRHWNNMRNIEKTRGYKTQELMGRAIYHRTIAKDEKYIGNLETEPYLISGSYHDLANGLLVGWHPDYKKKLLKFLTGKQ